MAEQRKCDNNWDSSSDKKQAHKTDWFETKLDILKHTTMEKGMET
jgi:hypothetical protein